MDAPAPTEKRLHCNRPLGGCGRDVPEADYHKAAMLCRDCANIVGARYGIALEYVGWCHMDGLIPSYERKFEGFAVLDHREKVRILALAAGCEGVRNPTDRERAGAVKIREACPELYRKSDRSEGPEGAILAELGRTTA